MKIYDISQPVFECQVFPGDIKPEKIPVTRMEDGSLYNLTNLSMCVHNGTHVDAPFHFIADGKGINSIALDKFIGAAYVVSHDGFVTKQDAESMLKAAEAIHKDASKKILIKGDATVTIDAARVFANAGIDLIGNESFTVGPPDSPRDVHVELLGKEVVLLEGIRLSAVPDGVYMLNCAPLNLSDTDGAPCRAVLIDML